MWRAPFPLALHRRDGRVVYLDIDAYADIDDLATRHRQLLARDAMLTDAKFAVVRVPAWQCLEKPHLVAREALQGW